ncbi:PREDICTED: uncharacterized protein LOC108568393 [Nicrophorus vespilloides]|uniref:Uncharacterized protein LOC108568393 n=1 Tax=Nicrophorus vespilloides TaxID=110193 RepID=A0ABM1NDP5_NICVS|nr:PREDICTED: uncharacterized protein LOC108568393 [Nicrophorus vespilloides]
MAQRPFAKGVFVEGRVSTRHNNGPSFTGSIPFHVPNHYRVVKRMPYKVIRIPIYENLPHFNKVQYSTQKPYWSHPMVIPVPRPEAPFKQIDLAAADLQPQEDPKYRIIFPSGLSQYTEKPYDYGHRPSIDSTPFKGSPRINYYSPQQNHPSDERQYKKGSSKPKLQSVIDNYSNQQYPQIPVNQMPEHTYNTQETYQKQREYISDVAETSRHLPSPDHFVPINQQDNSNQNQFKIYYERQHASASYGSKVPKSNQPSIFKNQYKIPSSKNTQTSGPFVADTNHLQYNKNGMSYQQPQKESIYKQELVNPFSTKVTQASNVETNTQLQYNQNQVDLTYQQPQVQSNYKHEIRTNTQLHNNLNQLGVSYQQHQVKPSYKQENTVATKGSNFGTKTEFHNNQNQIGGSYQHPQVESNYKQEIASPVTTKTSNVGTNTQYHNNQIHLEMSYEQPQVELNFKQEIASPVSTKTSNFGTNTLYQYGQTQLGLSYQQPKIEPSYKQEIASPVATKPSNVGTNTQYNYNQNQLGLGYQQPQVESSYNQEIASSVITKPSNVRTSTHNHYNQNQDGINYQQPQVESSYKQDITSPISNIDSKIGINAQRHYIQNQLGMNYKQPQVTTGYIFDEPKSPQSYINETPYKSDNAKNGLRTTSIIGNNVQIGNNQVGMVFKQPQVIAGYQIEEPQKPYNVENQYKHFTKLTVDGGNQKAQQQVYNQQKLGATYSQHQASASYKIEEPKSQSYNIGNTYENVFTQGNTETKLDGYRNIFTGNYDQPQVSASYKIEEPKTQEEFNSLTVSSGFGGQIHQKQQTNQEQSWKPSITNYESSQGNNFQMPKSNDHIYYQTPPEYQTQAPIFDEESKMQESSVIDYNHQPNLKENVEEYRKQQENNAGSSVISLTLDTNQYVPNVYQHHNPLNEESNQQFNNFGHQAQINNLISSNVYKTESVYNSNSMKSEESEVQNLQEFSPIVAKEIEDQVYQQNEGGSYQNQGSNGIPVWEVSERSTEENWKAVDSPKADTLSWKRNSYDMNAEDWLKMKEQHDVSSHMLRQGMHQAEESRMDSGSVSPEERGTRPMSALAEGRMSYPVHFLVSPQKEQLKGNNINFVLQENVPLSTAQ